MRISDWSSDVCSSDLPGDAAQLRGACEVGVVGDDADGDAVAARALGGEGAAVADVTVLGVAGERHGHDGGISELFALAHRAVVELHLDVVGRQRSERHHGLRPTVHADVGHGDVEVDVVDVHTLEPGPHPLLPRSEEHTSELQSLMRISYAGFCLKKKKN